MKKRTRFLAAAAALFLISAGTGATAAESPDVTRATLDNGLRVVIVKDDLAPVVTTQMNYLVGADEVPDGFPGTAHALEHMMFRGSPGLSKDQLMAVAANMGGDFNANTQHGVTQYYFTVPRQDVDLALHIASIRMRGLDVTAKAWKKERGAIEQEVSRDMSNPAYKFLSQMTAHMFADTPYARMGLGTRDSFDKTKAADLKKFHDTWYAPNNAILVIAGDVDADATLDKVKSLFGDIARQDLPEKPDFNFKSMASKTIKLPTDFSVGLVAKVWRMPGLRDDDYATARVLANAMGSKRGDLFEMGLTGKALFGGFSGNFRPHAGMAFAQAGFRRGGDSDKVMDNLEKIIRDTADNGVPADLVKAAKQQIIADTEYKKNSVQGLANSWSAALANRDADSPDDLIADIRAVTPEDVNALARRVLDPDHAVTAVLTPESSGAPTSQSSFSGSESFNEEPKEDVELPDWAKNAFADLKVPESPMSPESYELDNGLRVIVQPEKVSDTVEVFGRIDTNSNLQSPKGKEGVAGVLGGMFNYGTQDMQRLQFQAALDAISAHESAGTSFSLAVPSDNFEKGMKLLAANELHPAMPQRAFAVMQKNQSGAAAGRIKSPGFLNSHHTDKALLPEGDPQLRYAKPDTIDSLSLDDVKNYYDAVFRPDMTTIVIIGNVDPEQARDVVANTFGDWQAEGNKPETDYASVPLNKAGRFQTPDSSAKQASVTLTQMVDLGYDDPDRYALRLGSQVLGSGFNSLLMHDLRSKHGLVYGVSSGVSLSKNRGRFHISYGSDPDKVDKARSLALRDVRKMQDETIDDDRLHAAKGKKLRQIQLRKSSFGTIAGQLLTYGMENKPLNSDTIAAQKYYDMTADQIQSAFQQYVRPDAFVTAVKGSADAD